MEISFGVLILIIIAILILISVALLSNGNDDNGYDDKPHEYIDFEQREIKRAGDAGEKFFRDRLRYVLNENDILINNLVVESDGQTAEIDNLIINENGIFIIEVKNFNGTLYGSVDDYSLTKRKVSPGGNVFIEEVKNPIRQMKRQTGILSRYLRDNNIWIWIEPYAFLARENILIDEDGITKNIDSLDEIIHTKREKAYRKSLIDKAVNLLSN